MHLKNVHKEKTEICSHCNKGFKTTKHLKSHIKSVHLKVKDIECQLCDAKFTILNYLYQHMTNFHGEKIKCDLCDQLYPRGRLKPHIKEVHQNIRTFKCNECEFTFKQKSHLRTHIKEIHKKLKDFACSFCESKFARKSDLKKHVKRKHY